MFLCGDDEEAKRVVAGLIDDTGFVPVDLGRPADAAVDGGAAPPGRRLRRGGPRGGGAGLRRELRSLTPTLYEWAGGAEALDRLTAVLLPPRPRRPDPVARVRRDVPDHPHHVALWLGEVFGGPPVYTEEHGGYPHMVAKHLGLALTEEQRARWVALITPAADDAGLPADPEFRSALLAYVEWGTRIALANSQPGAAPPPAAPVPHWGRGEARRTTRKVWSGDADPPFALERYFAEREFAAELRGACPMSGPRASREGANHVRASASAGATCPRQSDAWSASRAPAS